MYPGCDTQIPDSADPLFFSPFQPEGHFFPPLTPLWHIPMRKSRHHKAAIGEMEKLLVGTAFMFFVGEFHEGSEGGFGFFRMLVHVRPFVNVNTFVKLPLKMEKGYSGKKPRGAFFQGSYSHSETRERQSSAGSGDGGVVSGAPAGSVLSS